MINFNDLQVVESAESSSENYRRESRIMFIAGADPFRQTEENIDNGFSVFCVYSKINGKTIFTMKTKKNFDWFLDYIKIFESFNNRLKQSRKFINTDGRAKSVNQIRIETGGFKEYFDPQ